jgi:hypothetical protein
MTCDRGFLRSFSVRTVPVRLLRIRGELAIASAAWCRMPHMRVGPSRLALIDVGGNLDKKPYCLIGECSRDVERCLTNRAPVASLVLGPSRSSFSVSLIKAY